MNKDSTKASKSSKQSTKNQKNIKSTKTKKISKTYIKQTGCWGPDLSSKQLHELNELFGNNK